MGDALVGARAEPKKSYPALRLDHGYFIRIILDLILCKQMIASISRLVLLLVCLAMLSCEKKPRVESAVEDETTLPTPVRDDRPPITIRLTDGTDVKVKEQKSKMILVLFQPDCDHCQDEAKQIRQQLEAFKDYQMYFISSESLETILKFSKDYELFNKDRVSFGYASVDDILSHFGSISTPSIYIYKESGELIQSFDGLVDVSVIIQYL